MPKRHRRVESSSESEYNDKDSSSSEFEQGSSKFFTGKKTSTSQRKPALKRTKTKEEDDSERIATPHAARTHIRAQIHTPSALVDALILWYNGISTRRGMPWRKPWDPDLSEDERAQRAYEVWVSEIMLQQTQVATVISYYNNWMKMFPTLPALAAASIEEVNAAWKGLGYYSRASRLLAGAQKAVKTFDGKLPPTATELQAEIPGIGRYSAGAIASIAYGERAPVLDGNVHRLMSRVVGLYANPKSKATLDILWAAAGAMVAKGPTGSIQHHPGDINQALIELGSTVCKVQNPDCSSCPIATHCSAYRRSQGNVEHASPLKDIEDLCKICEPLPENLSVTIYPCKAEKKKAREEMDIVNVVEWKSLKDVAERQVLLVKRPEKGLLAGLFEFPALPNATGKEKMKDVPSKLLPSLIDFRPAMIKSAHELGDVLHLFSHIRKVYRAQHVLLESETLPAVKIAGCKWVKWDEVGKANIGTGIGKVWKLAQKFAK
ncbi:DNA glycosylase [Flagelloscypha sp. PMI_526]|nr:DNA glycosylase [Flagelloscypha sp. PMI_526]